MTDEKSNHRIEKVEKELREIIATYILRHFPSSMLGVNQVLVSKDLRGARIFMGVFGGAMISDEKLKELQAHAFDMQKQIAEKLRMRYCPRLKFVKDEGAAAAARVDDLLAKIKS